MKLLIVAGGGGHFVAALAVIQQLPKDWETVVVGRKFALEGDEALALEYQTCQKLAIPFETLTTGRLQRRLSKETFSSLFKIPSGLKQARSIIAKHKPDMVVSFGGYVSVPVVAAAAFSRLPIIVHEQTHHAGLAAINLRPDLPQKFVFHGKIQKRIFAEKTILTGNPLRKEFLAAQSLKPPHPAHAIIKKVLQNLPKGALLTSSKKTPTIYVTGGSAGAHGINVLIEGCLERLLHQYRIIHQTGDASEYGDYDRLEQLRQTIPEALQKRYELHKFIHPNNVADILTHADLVVSRSGINTVTELLYLGKPTLFIPLPYGQRNEQQTNADYVKKQGLAEVVNQNMIDSIFLQSRIETMMQNLEQYKKNGESAKQLIKVDAAQHIVEVIKEVYAQKKNKS